MSKDTCETCKYWQRHIKTGDPSDTGKCYRYPSIVIKNRIEWCGEHLSLPEMLLPMPQMFKPTPPTSIKFSEIAVVPPPDAKIGPLDPKTEKRKKSSKVKNLSGKDEPSHQ